MAFTTGYLPDQPQVGAGERYGNNNIILTARTFEDGLKVGRFAKLDSGSLDNLDGSATPVIAGVVLRTAVTPIEDAGTIDSTLYGQVEYVRQGLVTVDVKAGESPAQFGPVYADNATGEATATGTDIAVSGEYIEQVQAGVWLIRLY